MHVTRHHYQPAVGDNDVCLIVARTQIVGVISLGLRHTAMTRAPGVREWLKRGFEIENAGI